MILSADAIKDLRKILEREIGEEKAKNLSDEELKKIGLLLLTILAENLKMKAGNS